MFSTGLHFDKTITGTRLARAFASAAGVPVENVRVTARDEFERNPRPWFAESDSVGLQTSRMRGDFPLEVVVVARFDLDLGRVLVRIARDLGVAILTDAYGVNSLSDVEWLMIAPDGSSTRVIADSEEFGADDPAIILEPESRAIHEAKRSRRVIAAD
jgi:hypothetical protein